MNHMYQELLKGEKIYIGTQNKAWFLQRFKDATGAVAEFTSTIHENMFEIKLVKDEK